MSINPEEAVFSQEREFFVTTSSSHPGGAGYWLVKAPDYNKARLATFEALGDKWCFMYDSLENVHELDRNCHGVIQA